MVRVFMVGSYSQKLKVDAKHEKIAVQTIHRELHYANEANLLEERDMHVFDSRPLKDPLHLVCCNACKKPVKASQYPAHAVLCRSFSSTEDLSVGIDCINGYKKPLKKGRKNFHTREDPGKERYESSMGDDGTASDDITDAPNGMLHSHSGDVQNVPAPLATKVYHLQGSQHLRASLGRLYHRTYAKNQDIGSLNSMHGKDVHSPVVSYPN